MKKVFIASILLSSSLFLSRVIGYLRDAIIAAKFGAGVETDAYFAAFTLPDFLNYMVAGGAFSITFIPIFTNYIVKKKEDDGWRLYSIIISVMSLIIVTAIVILEIFTPQIVSSLFPGFKGDILDRTIFFTRIVLPAQLFFYNGGIISAILMSKKRFLIPALAPLIYNISIIVFGVALSSFGMTGFAIGVLIGAFFGPFFIQFWALRKEIKFKFLLKLKDPDFIRFIKLSLPLIAGLILVTLDDWLSKRFGSSFQQGTVSWINNSRRLVLVPIGLFAQANAQALLPFLSEYFAKKEFKQFNNLLKSGITFVIFITTFASSWFIVFHYEIIRLIYQRGAFLPFHTLKTSEIFLFFCFGIPFWGGIIMFSRFYYAMEHTIIPMLTGIAMSLLSLPIFYYLPKQMGESGLSATISIVKVVYFITLVTFFIPFYRKRSNDGYKFFDGKKIFLEIFKIVLFFSIITSIFVVIKSKIDFNWILTLFVGSFIQLFISLILLKYSKIDGYKKFSDRYLSKISRRVKIFKIFTV